MLFIGCDWARCKHDVLFMDVNGEVIDAFTVDHDQDHFDRLAERIAQLEPNPGEVYVAIEGNDGAFFHWLLDQAYRLYPINPKAAQRARDVFRPAGAKDDRGDSHVLAELIRVSRAQFTPMTKPSSATVTLRAWTRLRARCVRRRTAVCQQLRDRLTQWSPALARVCDDLNRRWQRELIALCPTHEHLRACHGNRLNHFLHTHRLAQKTRQRVQRAHHAPTLHIPAGRLACLEAETLGLLDMLNALIRQIERIDAELKPRVDSHPDASVFQSLPVHGLATTATLIAAFGDDRTQPTHWRPLAARWGVSPITKQSGKHRSVHRRAACDHHINQALLFLAFNTAFKDGCWAKHYYARKRAEHMTHYTALRCLAQRWVKILHRLWRDRLLYDETIRRTQMLPA